MNLQQAENMQKQNYEYIRKSISQKQNIAIQKGYKSYLTQKNYIKKVLAEKNSWKTEAFK